MDKKATLYIIQGFIGAGKTTFSKMLSKQTGAIHFNPDEYISKFYTKDDYMKNWDKCFSQTVDNLWQETKKYLKNGTDVIFDMGFWIKKDRTFARKIASECNANIKHYYLYVPDEILKKRIIENRPQEWALIHLKNFDNNKIKFEIPTPEENAIIINNY